LTVKVDKPSRSERVLIVMTIVSQQVEALVRRLGSLIYMNDWCRVRLGR